MSATNTGWRLMLLDAPQVNLSLETSPILMELVSPGPQGASGSAAAVTSVNGATGAVVLGAADVGAAAAAHGHAIADVSGLQTALDGKLASGAAAGGDLSGSYPNPAVETRGRIAFTTQYRMDGTSVGDFLAPTSDSGAVTFSTYAEMTTQQGVFRSRCAIRHNGATLPGTPTWQLGQHAGVEVEASIRVVDFDTATHQFMVGIHRLHTCGDLVTIGAETLIGFYPKNGTWWVGVYISDGMNACDNFGVVNHDTGISTSVDRLLRVVAFPGQSGALFYIGGVPVYRYSGALEDSFYATIAYLGCMLQDRAGTSAFGAKVRVNSMVARHTMARNDPRLSDARTPTAHKSTHETGGTDALTPADIGAAAAVHTHAISNVTGLQTALDNKVDDSQFSVFGLDLVDSADAATARATLGLGTTDTPQFAGISLASGEFISNSANGRIDIGPNGTHPSQPSSDYYALTVDGQSWGFGVRIGTRNTRTDTLNTSSSLNFLVPVVLNNDTRFAFGSSQNYFIRHVSGSSRAGVACGLLVNNAGSTGALVIAQGNEIDNANRIPATAHAHPTLYLYGGGSANANDFFRLSHDTTNATLESGRGSLNLVSAGDINNNGNRIPKVFSGTTAPSAGTGTDGDLYFQY
jgi:hypothetical protein